MVVDREGSLVFTIPSTADTATVELAKKVFEMAHDGEERAFVIRDARGDREHLAEELPPVIVVVQVEPLSRLIQQIFEIGA